MTTSEWISLGASIGAMGAAFVAVFTLLELSKQRRSSYKPDLCVLKNRFHIGGEEPRTNPDFPFAMDWIPEGSRSQQVITWPTIRVVNVGFGAAKRVSAKWVFDTSCFVEEVNELAQKTYQTFFIREEEYFLSIMSKGRSTYRVNNRLDTFDFEYLLPVATQPSGHDIGLLPSFPTLISLYLGLCAKANKPISEISPPSIVLELSYGDIGQQKHYSKHKLEVKLGMMSLSEDDKDPPSFTIELVEVAY
jgi:hypothetical protein